jgi:hypothetical protein
MIRTPDPIALRVAVATLYASAALALAYFANLIGVLW